MFYDFDNTLIAGTQYIVSRLELYTILTKKIVTSMFIEGVRWFSVSSVLFFVFLVTAFDYSFINIINMTIASLFTFLISGQMHEILDEKEIPGILPKVISKRRWIRVMWFIIFCLQSSYLFLIFSLKSTIAKDIDTILMNLQMLSLLFAEYLLCTTSLPPGEKEKNKQEKEMRTLITQKING